MKKLLGLALACALLLTGCGARGGDKGEELGDNTIRPLELTEEEEALLKLVGGSDAEYTIQFSAELSFLNTYIFVPALQSSFRPYSPA